MEGVVLHAECGDGVGEISRLANAFGPGFHVGANARRQRLYFVSPSGFCGVPFGRCEKKTGASPVFWRTSFTASTNAFTIGDGPSLASGIKYRPSGVGLRGMRFLPLMDYLASSARELRQCLQHQMHVVNAPCSASLVGELVEQVAVLTASFLKILSRSGPFMCPRIVASTTTRADLS